MPIDKDLPEWLRDAIQVACEAHELGGYGHVGWSVVFGCDGWEVWVYPAWVEMVGGAHDGEKMLPDHRVVCLSEIVSLFDEPPAIDWMQNGDDITEVSVEGKVGGHEIWLHMLEEPPEDTGAMATFDVNSGTFEDKEPSEDE